MYTKRTYIVPQLNLKDGILLHIHGGVEGVEDVSPLSSALELYEVTDLDGGNFTANPSYSSLSNMELWKKYPYRSTALMFHPEEGEIVYLIDLDGGRETYGKGARMVAKVDGDPERVKRVGRRFKRDFYAKARESAQYVNVEGDTITIDVSLTVPKA